MERTELTLAERLGFRAYLFVMGGGLRELDAIVDDALADGSASSAQLAPPPEQQSPFVGTMPLEIQEAQREAGQIASR